MLPKYKKYYGGGKVKYKRYKGGGKNTDTVPAMLTPGEVVLNEEQQTNLEQYVGKKRAKIFGDIGVPGFERGGEVEPGLYAGRYIKGKKKTLKDKLKTPKKSMLEYAKNKIYKEEVKEEKKRRYEIATKDLSKEEKKKLKKGIKHRKSNIYKEKYLRGEAVSRISDAQRKIDKAKAVIKEEEKRKSMYKGEMNPTRNWKSKSARPSIDRYGKDYGWETDKPIKLRTHGYNLRRGYYKEGSTLEGDEPMRYGYRSNIHEEDHSIERKGNYTTRGKNPALYSKMYSKLRDR